MSWGGGLVYVTHNAVYRANARKAIGLEIYYWHVWERKDDYLVTRAFYLYPLQRYYVQWWSHDFGSMGAILKQKVEGKINFNNVN